MSVAPILDVRSLALCPVCYDSYDDKLRRPMITPCGNAHTVCSSCIKRILEVNDNSADDYSDTGPRCPVCAVDFSVESFAEIPVNRDMYKLIEEFDSQLKQRAKELSECSECSESTREKSCHVCLECSLLKGPQYNLSSNEFKKSNLSSLVICSTCVLENHNTAGHLKIKYSICRIILEQRSMDITFTVGPLFRNAQLGKVWTDQITQKLGRFKSLTFSEFATFTNMRTELQEFVKKMDTHVKGANSEMEKLCKEMEDNVLKLGELYKKYSQLDVKKVSLAAPATPEITARFEPESIVVQVGATEGCVVTNTSGFNLSYKLKYSNRGGNGRKLKAGPNSGTIAIGKSVKIFVSSYKDCETGLKSQVRVLLSSAVDPKLKKEFIIPIVVV